MSEQTREALIVGGTGGLGMAIAADLLRESGGRVTVTAATAAEASIARDEPKLRGARIEVLDVRDSAAVEELIGGLECLDVLVNAAGVPAGPADLTVEGFARTVDINLTGTARTCFAARELLERSEGSIVNFASMMSFRGSATGVAYAASKGGVHLLTMSLAAAWGPRIRVNAIAPGFMDTPMTVGIQADEARNRRIMDHTPAGRWGMPEDLVGAVRFLTSDAARFVNGIVLPVDGGYLTT